MKRPLGAALALVVALPPSGSLAQQPGEMDLEPVTFKAFDGTEVEAERGELTVLENRDEPSGRTITLPVLRFKSTSVNPGPPIVYLAGGPGGSAIGAAQGGYFRLFNKLRAAGDVIFMDQRGTGRSQPRLSCVLDEQPPGDLFASYDRMMELRLAVVRKCAEHWREHGVDIASYNTEASADDVEDLRRALGAGRLSLLGFSYGTHFGLATIRRHGPNLHRAVLVGTEGPAHNQKLPSTYNTQLKKLSMLAASDPDVHKKVPDMVALLKRLLDQLRSEPRVVTVTDRARDEKVDVTVTDETLQFLIRMDVGDGNDFPIFPAWFYAMDQGDDELTTWFVAKRYNGLADGVSVMSVAMDCASGTPPLRARRIEAETQGALLGRMVNLGFPEICEAVGNPDLGPEYRSPIRSDVETLFISGSLDSNTPPYQAEEVRWGFASSTHLVVEYAGHEDMIPNREVQQAILDFFLGQDVRDRSIALSRPDFIPIIPTGTQATSNLDPVGAYDFETVVFGNPLSGTVHISKTEGGYGGVITRSEGSDIPVARIAVDGHDLFVIADVGQGNRLKLQFKIDGDAFTGVWWMFNRVGGGVTGTRQAP